MTVLVEGDLEFTITGVSQAWKFDRPGKNGHGLVHCMKAVDFIIESASSYEFIEVKGGSAKTSDLVYKYRDSFLYEWASNRANKRIYFWVVIGNPKIQPAELLTRTEDLKRNLPMKGPQGKPWSRPLVHDCGVFNIATWNKYFPNYFVARLTS